MKANTPLRILAALLAPLLATVALAGEGFWVVDDANGNWNDAGNWTGTATPPNEAGDIANVTVPLTATRVVSLQTDVTLGSLLISNDGYQIGPTIGAAPNLVFDNNGAPAYLSVRNLNTRNSTTEIRHPMVVTDQLVADFTETANSSVNVTGGVKGDANARLELTYQLTSGTGRIEFRNNQQFFGTVDLRRVGTVDVSRGIYFNDNNGIFAGGPGSIRVHPGVALVLRGGITDEIAGRFTFFGAGQSTILESSGTIKDVTNPSHLVHAGGLLHLNHSTATVLQRYPTGAELPLDNTEVRLTGYNTSPGRVNEEFPGTMALLGGANRIWIENRSHADSVAGMHFDGFARSGTATLTLRGSGRGGDPLGSTEWNRVTVKSGLPAEVNGILPSYIVHYSHSGGYGANGLFVRIGDHGLTPFEDYDAVNDFSLGANAVVEVTAAQNLGGGRAEVYALRSRAAITNGDLVIHSGGLILGGAFNTWTADLYFGANGEGDAYVHLDGHTDQAKEIRFEGVVHCRNFVKFGGQWVLELRAANQISGRLDLQDGGLILRHPLALGSGTDIVMGLRTRLQLGGSSTWNPAGSAFEAGGLSSINHATIRAHGTANESLMLQPAAETEHVFRGTIIDEAGRVGVIVAGTGRQVFNGPNNYTGDTQVNAGATLLLGDDGILGATTVTVASGGTFGGTGSLQGELVLADGAILKLTPGQPLRAGSLDTAASATIIIDLADNETIVDGIALEWTGDSPADEPALSVVGAPSDPSGSYKAEYDAGNRQIQVAFVQHGATLILIR